MLARAISRNRWRTSSSIICTLGRFFIKTTEFFRVNKSTYLFEKKTNDGGGANAKDIQLPRSSLSSDVGKDWVDFRAGSLQLGGRYYRRRPPRALLCNHSTILPFPLANSISYTLDSKGWKKYVRQEALFRCCCCCCSPRN